MRAGLPMLRGYRVLDITQFVAGPTCTRIMAELGADVIKVELAPFGDRGRASGDKPREDRFKTCSQSTYYFQHNHSKRSLAVDIKQPRGRPVVEVRGASGEHAQDRVRPNTSGTTKISENKIAAGEL